MKKVSTNKYMFLVRGPGCASGALSPEQMQANMQEVFNWIDGLTKKGVMTAAQPLTPDGKMVSGKGGTMISDGIAAESKEAVGGFFIVNATSMEDAICIARTCPVFNHGGMLEVRQIAELKCD